MSAIPFRHHYHQLLVDLMDEGTPEHNARTGHTIRVGNPTSFVLDLEDGRLPVCGIRKTFPRTAAAEVAWFLQGRKDVTFIRDYAPIWDAFVEDDGHTVAGAYGHRWRNHFGRDQIGDAVKALIDNPSDRRVFISAWDPGLDGLGKPSKNVPCPVGFTLSITGGRLNSTLLIRSSDVFVGLPYDVMGHALLMAAFMATINKAREERMMQPLTLGKMQVSLAHPHLYEVHLVMANAALISPPSDDTIIMPTWGLRRIVAIPDAYVAEVKTRQDTMTQPPYMCRPELVL